MSLEFHHHVPADLYIALWLLSHTALAAPYSGEVCLNGTTPPLCSIQITSGSLPLFGSLYDGDYTLPPAQGFPDWFFAYKDRMKYDAVPPASCSDSRESSQDSARPPIFTFYPDPPPSQTHSTSEACHDNMF